MIIKGCPRAQVSYHVGYGETRCAKSPNSKRLFILRKPMTTRSWGNLQQCPKINPQIN